MCLLKYLYVKLIECKRVMETCGRMFRVGPTTNWLLLAEVAYLV